MVKNRRYEVDESTDIGKVEDFESDAKG